MRHDRIHAREPSHHRDRWTVGTVEAVTDRDGHAVITVRSPDDESLDLVVTHAVRDLFVRRLDLAPDGSPVGERVWYRRKRD